MQPLEYYLTRATEAGACAEDIEAIRACGTIEEVMKHPRAPYWAYWYAFHAIKGRWLEAEDTIRTDAEDAYWYARHVIKGRWPKRRT